MTAESIKIPVAWLRPTPVEYTIPLWRWLLLPATTLMLKRNGGVWLSGDLELTGSALRFTRSKPVKLSSTPVESWTLAIEDVVNIDVRKGLASETLLIQHTAGTEKLLTARSDAFLRHLRDVTARCEVRLGTV